jgi:hypothetical protein
MRLRMLSRELLHEDRFADAGLAAHESDAAGVRGGSEPLFQIRQGPFTLQQFHGITSARTTWAQVVADRNPSSKDRSYRGCDRPEGL